MNNKAYHFSLILGLVAVAFLLSCGGPTEKSKKILKMENKIFNAWQLHTIGAGSSTYLILKQSRYDLSEHGLWMNVTGFLPTQIDSILTRYKVVE